MMGLKWLAEVFYPERWDGDLAGEVRDFWKLHYHIDLSEEKPETLLEANGRPPKK